MLNLKIKRMNVFKTILILSATLILNLNLLGQVQFPDIEHWEKSERKLYTSETLWEYINGAADYYVNYSFQKLEVVEYALTESNYIKAEVYIHSSPLYAFGIYAYERPSRADFFSIGAQGYMQHSALNYFGNNYYIKVHSNQTDEETKRTIKTIAEQLAVRNIESADQPEIFTSFPQNNKIDNTEKYYPNNYLGYDFFHSALEVAYKKNDDKFKLFMMQGKDSEEANNMLKSYFEFVGLDASAEQGKIYEINDTFNDLVVLMLNGDTIYGVYDTDKKKVATEYIKLLSAN